jgi:hypothetical protein
MSAVAASVLVMEWGEVWRYMQNDEPRVRLSVENEPWAGVRVTLRYHDQEVSILLPPQAASDMSAELFHAAVAQGATPWLPRQADRG